MGILDDRANLTGKVALVAGGAGGLGLDIVRALREAGVVVAACDRDEQAVARLASELSEQTPVPGLAQTLDVRDDDALEAFYEAAASQLGRLDILVNVVGGTFQSPFMATNARGWDALIRTNFRWVLSSIQFAAARMQRFGHGGSIINLSSVSAWQPTPGAAVHGAMKAAVEHFARAAAVELGPSGIRVNNIPMFMVQTEDRMAATSVEQRQLNEIRDRLLLPLQRSGRPEDITSAVLFLASDLSAYITGATLCPDGGRLATTAWFNWPDSGYSLPMSPSVLRQVAAEADRDMKPE
jgi:NAD(P)-dependent dehydrogenase (short-subunit alcohol dehydrogenase family)